MFFWWNSRCQVFFLLFPPTPFFLLWHNCQCFFLTVMYVKSYNFFLECAFVYIQCWHWECSERWQIIPWSERCIVFCMQDGSFMDAKWAKSETDSGKSTELHQSGDVTKSYFSYHLFHKKVQVGLSPLPYCSFVIDYLVLWENQLLTAVPSLPCPLSLSLLVAKHSPSLQSR